jgi:hypothetical protein
LLYDNPHDSRASHLQIDDSVQKARERWNWSELEDRLKLQSAEETAEVGAARVNLRNAENTLKKILEQHPRRGRHDREGDASSDDDDDGGDSSPNAHSKQVITEAKTKVATALRELEAAFDKRKRTAIKELECIRHAIADRSNGCTGAVRVSDRIDLWMAKSHSHPYTSKEFRNGCNVYGLIDPNQSFLENFIVRRMGCVDKVFRRVNSHQAFFKSDVVRSQCFEVQLGMMRSCIYLDGDAGAGKTALIDLICETSISYDKILYETDKAMTTEATDAMSIHAMSEITCKYAGFGNDGVVDPVMKEALSSGFVSVRSFHKDDSDPTRRLRATGALFLVSMIAAGNFPFSSFPAEVRQRWTAVYVSSAMEHPEAPTYELKDNTLEIDRQARDKIIQEFTDENAVRALFVRVVL